MSIRSFPERWLQGWALTRLAGVLLLGGFTASAHETDNFYLPLDTELADLGDYLEAVHTIALEEAAYGRVLEHYTEGGLLSEEAIFGTFSTGIYSNADLAVNHVGFKFFMNLTEKVTLNSQEREPLVIRCGVFWRLNQHVRLRSGWFGAFVSDHWNEALNPSRYKPSMRSGIRRVLQSRARDIVQFYTQKDGRPNDPDYFESLARELSTYRGEPYGHSGRFEELMTIGNTCIPAIRPTTPSGEEPFVPKR